MCSFSQSVGWRQDSKTVNIHTTHKQQPEDAAKVRRYRFEKDRRLALGSQLLQRAVIAWTFGVPYQDILIARTGGWMGGWGAAPCVGLPGARVPTDLPTILPYRVPN